MAISTEKNSHGMENFVLPWKSIFSNEKANEKKNLHKVHFCKSTRCNSKTNWKNIRETRKSEFPTIAVLVQSIFEFYFHIFFEPLEREGTRRGGEGAKSRETTRLRKIVDPRCNRWSRRVGNIFSLASNCNKSWKQKRKKRISIRNVWNFIKTENYIKLQRDAASPEMLGV